MVGLSFWNRPAEELYGWREEEAIGQDRAAYCRDQSPKPLEEIESDLVQNWTMGRPDSCTPRETAIRLS